MHKQKLHQLQIDQLLHDQKYHADILCLPVQRRANHMALHFAKYAGKFTQAKLIKDRELFIETLVDTFVICLASTNMFNIEVGDLGVFNEVETKSFENLGTEIFSFTESRNEDVYAFVSDNMTMLSGRIAKSIESLDHMEPYPFRESFEKNLESIIGIIFVAASFLKINLISNTQNRLKGVEKKSIFYSDYQTGKISIKSN